jgi:type I restriction enzyme S subunit
MSSNQKIILADFVYYFTQSDSYKQWKDSIFSQATIQNISADKYNDFIVCYPLLNKQKEICNYLDQATGKIDTVLKKIEKQIALIKEYRSTLISNAVTGKIMVN